MDVEVVRYNERYKALANFCDNSALAFFVASVAKAFDDSASNFLIAIGVGAGLAFLVSAWHIRSLIQLEVE